MNIFHESIFIAMSWFILLLLAGVPRRSLDVHSSQEICFRVNVIVEALTSVPEVLQLVTAAVVTDPITLINQIIQDYNYNVFHINQQTSLTNFSVLGPLEEVSVKVRWTNGRIN